MKEYRIVIDQGTSGTKAILFDTDKNDINIIDRLDLSHEQIFPQKGWVEHNPNEIKENVEKLIDKIIYQNKLNYSDILSISITNQRESVVIWDKVTGEPISNIMVWQCNRGLEICESLEEEGYTKIIKNKTGLLIDPYFSASKLNHFFKNNKISDQIMENLAIGTVDTWIIWNLTNGKKFVTDISNASRTLLYDIVHKKWDQELTELFSVPINSLPEVYDSVADFGSYQNIPIVSVVADSQSALAGHLGINLGDIKATLGTGSSLLMNVGDNIKIKSDSIVSTIAWNTNEITIYAAEGVIRSFGDILSWGKNSLELFDDFNKASKIAFDLDDNGGVYFIPALEGLGAPFWKPDMTAMFIGMTRDTKKEHLIRSFFESMAFQIRAVIDDFKGSLEKELKKPMQTLFVDGGASRNTEFMQMLADITNMEIEVDNVEELSALGTLILLGKNRANKKTEIYYPQKNYDEYYVKWKNIIDKKIKHI